MWCTIFLGLSFLIHEVGILLGALRGSSLSGGLLVGSDSPAFLPGITRGAFSVPSIVSAQLALEQAWFSGADSPRVDQKQHGGYIHVTSPTDL